MKKQINFFQDIARSSHQESYASGEPYMFIVERKLKDLLTHSMYGKIVVKPDPTIAPIPKPDLSELDAEEDKKIAFSN